MADVYLSVLLTLMFLKLKCILNKCTVYQIFALCNPCPSSHWKEQASVWGFLSFTATDSLALSNSWSCSDLILVLQQLNKLHSSLWECFLKNQIVCIYKKWRKKCKEHKTWFSFYTFIDHWSWQTVSLFLFWSLCLSVYRPLWSPLRPTSSPGSFTSTCTVRRAPCTASLTTRCPTSTCPI